MMKKLSGLAASCVLVLLAGCAITVTPPPSTTVRAENELSNVSLNINGTLTVVDEVDLYGVVIGDDAFSYVQSGTTSSEVSTQLSGTVTVSVDSAVGYVNGKAMYLFTGISDFSVTLYSGELNSVAFSGASVLAGARVSPKTRVRVDNALTNLVVDVGGVQTTVDAIDLAGVTVGDDFFSYVAGGTTSSSQATNSIGSVNVTIDSAYVTTKILGQSVTLGYAVTAQLSFTIVQGITNDVLIDETTAGAIIQSLAKRKAK